MNLEPWPTIIQPQLKLASEDLPPLVVKGAYGEDKFLEPAISMYVCGITPYDATHLGHAATYLAFDLINRYLSAQAKKVSFVENITDIDDPLLQRANRDQVDWQALAQSQIELFAADMVALHVKAPEHWVPVTETMNLVEAAVSRIWDQGFAYELEGDIYLRISPYLGELAEIGLSLEESAKIFGERGGDPTRRGKEHPLDPLLWRKQAPGEPCWPSKFGAGRPGWHIECTVISLRYLLGDDYLDKELATDSNREQALIEIQGGGSDLLFPHHFMSGVQARALIGRPFAKSYIHAGMIGWQGEKMSKSKGNLVFVSKLRAAGHSPMAIRWALLLGHYQSDRMWSEELLSQAESSLENLLRALSMDSTPPVAPVITQILSALADNLDTPRALAAVNDWVNQALSGAGGASDQSGELARVLDSILGIAL